VTLTGSTADQLRALETSIAYLQRLRHELTGDSLLPTMPPELHGPYLNAPVWPWFLAGWIVGALMASAILSLRDDAGTRQPDLRLPRQTYE